MLRQDMDKKNIELKMLGKYFDKYLHIKENVKVDSLKNEGKIKFQVRQKRKTNQL